MKALKTIGITLAILVVVILAMGFIAPKKITVEKEIVIDAPREVIFPYLQNFAKQQTWSPWRERDPNIQEELRGTDGTVGAVYYWKGNKDVGEGEQEIKVIVPNERIETELRFFGQGDADAFLAAEDVNEGTKVTWGFATDMPFPDNIFAMLFNMKSTISNDYETGLSKLKELAEAEKNKTYRGYAIQVTDAPAKYFIGTRKVLSFEDLQAAFAENLPKAHAAVTAAGIEMAGMPCGLTFLWDEAQRQTDVAFVMPIKTKATVSGMETFEIPAGKMLVLDYYGDYEAIAEAHYAMDDYMKEHSLQQRLPIFEEYVTDPATEPDTSKWLTRVYYPVQ